MVIFSSCLRHRRRLLLVFLLIGLIVFPVHAIELELLLVDGRTHLLWTSTTGQSYEVQVSDDLTPAGWSTLETVIAQGATTTWEDPNPAVSQRFFRVRLGDLEVTPAEGRFVHTTSSDGLLQDLGAVSFPIARERLLQMASSGEIVLPIPDSGISFFEDIDLSNLVVQISNQSRAIVVLADAGIRGQTVRTILIGLWGMIRTPPSASLLQ